jgi:hypothetical protein
MKSSKSPYFFLMLLLFSFPVFSQEKETENNIKSEEKEFSEENESSKKHAISFVLSHTHIRSGIDNKTGDDWIAAPSFAINYNYLINEKWAIGLHTDIITEEFIVSDNTEESEIILHKNEEVEVDGLERNHPVASAVMITFKAHEHFALLAGGGMEFSKEENFALVRLGVEVPFEIPGNWEIFGAFTYDINIDAYNSVNFGIGIAKLF